MDSCRGCRQRTAKRRIVPKTPLPSRVVDVEQDLWGREFYARATASVAPRLVELSAGTAALPASEQAPAAPEPELSAAASSQDHAQEAAVADQGGVPAPASETAASRPPNLSNDGGAA